MLLIFCYTGAMIGIDARMYGPKVGGGGLGRYVEQLVRELQTIDRENRYVLFLKPENAENCVVRNDSFSKRVVDIHWYTLKEQLLLGKKIDAEKLDLMHFPHWNVPLNLRTPFVVTIHDLILLEEPRSARATTRHPLIYKLKYLGFRRVLEHAVMDSKKIIAVSEYTKQSILKHFPKVDASKIRVIYEGVTELSGTEQHATTNAPPTPFFLYVGNAYPHKNLEALLHAFSFFHKLHKNVKLVLAGRDDVFYQRLRKELEEIEVPEDAVRFIMNPSDAELAELYRNATLYLFPSRIEGFGLPALEAMQAGVPVAAARAGSLPEILGDAALYFHPDDIEEMVGVMEQALADNDLRHDLIQKGSKRVHQFSWHAMAEETRQVYEEVHHG